MTSPTMHPSPPSHHRMAHLIHSGILEIFDRPLGDPADRRRPTEVELSPGFTVALDHHPLTWRLWLDAELLAVTPDTNNRETWEIAGEPAGRAVGRIGAMERTVAEFHRVSRQAAESPIPVGSRSWPSESEVPS